MIQDIGRHKLLNQFRPDAMPVPDSYIFAFDGKSLAVRREGNTVHVPRYAELPEGTQVQYLFTLDDTDCFLASFDGKEISGADGAFPYVSVRELRRSGFGPRHLIFAAFTAMQLAGWYRDNVYCGTCGGHTRPGTTERSLICPSCGRVIYPRVIPAVIVGVTDGDRLLLTKYAGRRGIPFYALIAGFTEIGETFEECVHREVMEEVGLKVRNIRYYGSQPWGIADDILAGFYCDVDGDPTVHLDTDELGEAVWTERKDITGQPDDFSLTHHMMMLFREGKEPR